MSNTNVDEGSNRNQNGRVVSAGFDANRLDWKHDHKLLSKWGHQWWQSYDIGDFAFFLSLFIITGCILTPCFFVESLANSDAWPVTRFTGILTGIVFIPMAPYVIRFMLKCWRRHRKSMTTHCGELVLETGLDTNCIQSLIDVLRISVKEKNDSWVAGLEFLNAMYSEFDVFTGMHGHDGSAGLTDSELERLWSDVSIAVEVLHGMPDDSPDADVVRLLEKRMEPIASDVASVLKSASNRILASNDLEIRSKRESANDTVREFLAELNSMSPTEESVLTERKRLDDIVESLPMPDIESKKEIGSKNVTLPTL